MVWFSAHLDTLCMTLNKQQNLPCDFVPVLKEAGVFRANPAHVFMDEGSYFYALVWSMPAC